MNTYDVIVVGGGPGGSSVSTMLAQAGRKVLLLERERFPRYHIGESLLSGSTELLKKLDVVEKMESAKYVKKFGVTWIWGAGRTPWTVYFKDALATPYDFGYQVDRASFDKMLLDNAREHAVTVMEESSVTSLCRDNGRVVGVEYSSPSGSKQRASSRWVVDASGQTNFITKQVAQKLWDEKLKNMALWSYWKGAVRPEGIDSGNTFLPTFKDGWWWFIPLRDEITSVGVVLDKRNYAAAKERGLDDYYLEAIDSTRELKERLSPAKMVDDLRVTMDWSYSYDSFHGPGYAAVGDAACFIDPLLSTGVHLAMLSGYLCAAAINTVLMGNSKDETSIMDFYQEQYSREFRRMKEQIYFLYGGHRSPDSYFWHARRAIDIPGAQPKAAFASLIAGAFEHRSWYRQFLTNLAVPESLGKLGEAIFKGEAVGAVLLPYDVPLALNPQWQKTESYAVDGLEFRRAQVLANGKGRTLPLTETLAAALSNIDGCKTLQEIVESLPENDDKQRASIKAAVNEAVTYGVLVTTREACIS